MNPKIERARDAVTDTIDKTQTVVDEGLDAARERFEAAAEELDRRYQRARKGAEKLSGSAREKYDAAVETLKSGYSKASKDIDRIGRDVNDYVRDNPGKSILIATSVGFVVGLLISRRRNDD